ncbi:MAG: thiamine pyrophosphate-binding protein [Victivallaceae bacterium]|nr:thiamine pyrophosphate-binding protein [Victivallaceae bacterium]
MRVADYIFKTLADRGAKHVFLVTGGGAMHLNDGLRCEKRLTPVCCHHEQACAIAAEGYVRSGAGMGVVSVTSGPGGTNTMTGVIGQWLDSIPVIYISGQVKFETTIMSCPELGLRQLGDQEINIVDIVRPVTKYCKAVTDPKSIRAELEKALFYAFDGRPGPVWLDVPLNVQGALIDENELTGFNPPAADRPAPSGEELSQLVGMLKNAQRPLVIAGHGISVAGARDRFRELLKKLGVPAVTTFCGFDLLPEDDPLYVGRIGTLGQRAGNFILQNADLVISIGSRNNIRQVSYNWQVFARSAKKVSIDIDGAELKKKLFVPDLAIRADAGEFIDALDRAANAAGLPDYGEWRTWCGERKRQLPAVTAEECAWQDKINPYFFMRELTEAASADTDIVAGNGTACVALFQSGAIKAGQRVFWNSGCASMGYDLPAAEGACVGTGRTTVCLAGDGSLMMNLQELQTVIHRKLPLKIFLLDNDGYGSIKQTQSNFFGPELIGCDAPSGVSFPDFLKLAGVFGFKCCELATQKGLRDEISRILATPGPVFCVVRMPSRLIFSPKLSSKRLPDGRMISAPLEDMFPFLDREEFNKHMIVPPLAEE